jgi:hypothetical protein
MYSINMNNAGASHDSIHVYDIDKPATIHGNIVRMLTRSAKRTGASKGDRHQSERKEEPGE